MKYFQSLIVGCFVVIFSGCGEPYTPKELSGDEKALKTQLSVHAETEKFKSAFSESGGYVQVAVLDRHLTFPAENDMPGEYSRVLILHREQLDLDDYGFSLPGKEESVEEADCVPGFFNEVMFCVDKDGNMVFDDHEQPQGTELVVEWCVSNAAGDKVALHFGGIPCVTLDLSR